MEIAPSHYNTRMQVMRFATRAHMEAIFTENHGLWGRPFTAEGYREFWFSLFQTPWGNSNLRYMALTEEEDGPLLSSLKLYRLTGWLHGEPIVIAGIGAVYTPIAERTAGSASLLMSEVMDYMQKKKAALALLYTEIGTPFYERLGFTSLPAAMLRGGPMPQDRPGAGTREEDFVVRLVRVQDSALMAPLHERVRGGPLVVERDPLFWEFLLYKRKRYTDFAQPGAASLISFLAERSGSVLAAGFAAIEGSKLEIQELEALPGEEAALVAILDRIFATAREVGATTWEGPIASAHVRIDPRLEGETRPSEAAIPMVAPLGPTRSVEALTRDPELRFMALDQF